MKPDIYYPLCGNSNCRVLGLLLIHYRSKDPDLTYFGQDTAKFPPAGGRYFHGFFRNP